MSRSKIRYRARRLLQPHWFELSASVFIKPYDYLNAVRIKISGWHRGTPPSHRVCMQMLHERAKKIQAASSKETP